MPIRKRKRHVLCLHLHIHTDTNTCFNEPNSPSAAGAKRLARTSRRAVNMASSSSSSYRPLLKVPDKFSTQCFAGKCPSWVLPLWHRSLHCATLPTGPQQALMLGFQMPSKVCQKQNNNKKTTCLWAEQKTGSKWGLGSQKTSWWTIGLLSFPVRSAADGCPWLYKSLCTALMALWVSSRHRVTQCKLLSLQSYELIPGVINQTLRERKPQKVFLDILLLFARRSVNSLHLTNKSLPQRGEHWAMKHTLLYLENWLCICAPDLMYSLKDWWQLT